MSRERLQMITALKVKKATLILIAGVIWFFVGFNIMRIGWEAAQGVLTLWMAGLAVLVFLVFHNLVFRKMVKKHTARIQGYKEERQHVYRFFNKQAYLIMGFMITFGVGLRVSGLCPDIFIAFFYTGIGFLLIAGIQFFLVYTRKGQKISPVKNWLPYSGPDQYVAGHYSFFTHPSVF